MKIVVLGDDGYIGYPLTINLLMKGHEVLGMDNYSRRHRVEDLGSNSLTPILSTEDRKKFLDNNFGNFMGQVNILLGRDLAVYLKQLTEAFKPDAIIHLAEQPSAAWSMRDVNGAAVTQYENVIGTLHLLWVMKECCPEAHLIKLGTMGEYGTPDCDIPEGRIPAFCTGNSHNNESLLCSMAGLMFPRTAGSFYHLSKVHDTHNIEFACRNWHLRATDIMQGIVFGLESNKLPGVESMTRFDYDECFGTVLNRFCVQAILGMPLSIYGSGNQVRGFIPLRDSIKCIEIALNNPPHRGEYRTFNQFEVAQSIIGIADIVCSEASKLGISTSSEHLHNPRIEAEEHYYLPVHEKLFDLGYVPQVDMPVDINNLIEQLLPYRDRINYKVIQPTIKWRNSDAEE